MRDANVTETNQFEAPARTSEEGTERALARIADFSDHWSRHGFGIFGVFERRAGSLIGYCGLRYNDEFDGDLHISTMIDRPFWSMGLGSEVVRRNLEFAFLELDLEPVYAASRPIQLASIRLIEKFGFQRLPDRMLRHYPMAYAACSKEDFLVQHVAYLKKRLAALDQGRPAPMAAGLINGNGAAANGSAANGEAAARS